MGNQAQSQGSGQPMGYHGYQVQQQMDPMSMQMQG